ncbi:MAG TPA: hypothetical protein PK191_05150 [Niabella sp.]|nr:hypothetical protein [Niabella sp.]HOZ96072.1 hypothetical protein [Niabella sp.]HQW13438.1 hypothetical protein [Niabella sp.]HQX18832.1 hypothetical protein [Niabella sp.]HQX42462.1 hypothetical protein [Niabella sp.]
MDTIPSTTPEPAQQPKKTNENIKRKLRRILVSTVFFIFVNNFSPERVTKPINEFVESMITGMARLSPMNLWKSITAKEYEQEEVVRVGNFYERRQTGELGIADKVMNWLGFYWYTESGKAFWIGRILLLYAIIASAVVAKEDFDKASNKLSAGLFFPINMLIKIILFLLGVGVLCLIIYLVWMVLFALFKGLVTLALIVHSSGEFGKAFVEVIKDELKDTSKSKVLAFLFPFIRKQKKVQ